MGTGQGTRKEKLAYCMALPGVFEPVWLRRSSGALVTSIAVVLAVVEEYMLRWQV